jgi:hypothetical protein
MKKYTAILPTMWRSSNMENVYDMLVESKYVAEIIIIDNDFRNSRPLPFSDKVVTLMMNENIFVNPAWNMGAEIAQHEVILVGDDCYIPKFDSIIRLINKVDYDIVGIDTSTVNNGLKPIVERLEGEFERRLPHGYGSILFIKNYKYIPDNIKIVRGDVIQVLNSKNVYWIKNLQCSLEISKTVKSSDVFLKQSQEDIRTYYRLKQNTIGATIYSDDKNKTLLYTSITGNYDTNEKYFQVNLNSCSTDVRNARKSKILYHENFLLNEDDIVVWLDANIHIKGSLDFNEILGDNDIMLFEHKLRTDVYEEAIAARKRMNNQGYPKEEVDKIEQQINHYRDSCMVQQRPVMMSGMMIRRNNVRTRDFCRKWWSDIEKYSIRDQISFPMIKSDAKIGTMSWRFFCDNFKITSHAKVKGVMVKELPTVLVKQSLNRIR